MTAESPAVRRYGEVQYERAERAEAQVRALEERITELEAQNQSLRDSRFAIWEQQATDAYRESS